MHRAGIPAGRLAGVAGAILLFLPGMAAADDAVTHDLECYAAVVGLLSQSPDLKVRESAPLAATFYLGRLTEMGLAPAQIEKDIEDMALSAKQHPHILQPDFANACGAVPDAMLVEMNRVQARDRAAMMRERGPALKPP
jgi:hypothetical protein